MERLSHKMMICLDYLHPQYFNVVGKLLYLVCTIEINIKNETGRGAGAQSWTVNATSFGYDSHSKI